MQSIQPKSLIVGALLAIASVLAGEGLAHAECDRGTRQGAVSDALDGASRGYSCEVIELENGYFEAQCDDPRDASVAACDSFVDATYSAEVSSEDRYVAYEACMTIALHTGSVRQ